MVVERDARKTNVDQPEFDRRQRRPQPLSSSPPTSTVRSPQTYTQSSLNILALRSGEEETQAIQFFCSTLG